MKDFKVKSRYMWSSVKNLRATNTFHYVQMYISWILKIRLSKILNVSFHQKTQPRIYFQTRGRVFQTLDQVFESFTESLKLGWVFEKLSCAFLI